MNANIEVNVLVHKQEGILIVLTCIETPRIGETLDIRNKLYEVVAVVRKYDKSRLNGHDIEQRPSVIVKLV